MLIPSNLTSSEVANPSEQFFQEESFSKRRTNLMSELRLVSGLPEVIRACNPDTLYRLVAPEGAVLQQIPGTNDFRGVFYNEAGRIEEHARFAKVGPNILTVAKAMGSQILLVSIAMQLNDIQRSIEQLSLEMHRDRIAEIRSGESQFREAVLCEDELNQRPLIHNAIQSLHVGLKKTIAELRTRIAEAPSPESGYFEHLVQNKLGKAEKTMGLAYESFQETMRGLGILSQCYAALGEPLAAQNTVTHFIDEIAACDIEQAAKKARLLEPRGTQLPQLPWKHFLELEPAIKGRAMELASMDTYEIEFYRNEILESP